MEEIIIRRLKVLCKTGAATDKTITAALERGWITEAQYAEYKGLIEAADAGSSANE